MTIKAIDNSVRYTAESALLRRSDVTAGESLQKRDVSGVDEVEKDIAAGNYLRRYAISENKRRKEEN